MSQAGAAPPDSPPTFPAAAQPDIVRARQKDELFLRVLTDACHDAVRTLLGPRRAMLWSRETRLMAETLYFGLTTGTGLSTLGEEYCDILQVAGPVGVEPCIQRRGMLVFLETLMPYLTERLQQHYTGETAADLSGAGSASGWRSASSAGAANRWQQASQAVLARAASAWRVASQYSGVAVRLHLALFYFYGVYYQWSKRATGVRYMFVGKAMEQRSSYRVLGVLLFVQLGVSACAHAATLLMRSYAGAAEESRALAAIGSNGGADAEHISRQRRGERIVLLDEDSQEVAEPDGSKKAAVDSGDVPAQRRCPLCLGMRVDPTSTPCGHVFCWECIAEWGSRTSGATDAECPLCRAAFTLQQLVPVFHAGF